MKILVVGEDRIAAEKIFTENITKYTNQDFENAVFDVIYVDLCHIGMDEEFENIVDQIDGQNLKASKIVFLAMAGIDHEIKPTWLAENINQKELILEIQYVAKLIDETEIPYTIIRPTEVKSEAKSEVQIITEGQTITTKQVSEAGVVSLIKQAIANDQYINQSIGISDK